MSGAAVVAVTILFPSQHKLESTAQTDVSCHDKNIEVPSLDKEVLVLA